MSYTLYTNGVLEQDGFYIVLDELNPDYQSYLAWLALGNSPTIADASIYLAKQENNKASLAQIKTEYINMITRLGQIQTAVNPTNAQVIAAVKDEALYLERIMKLLRNIFT